MYEVEAIIAKRTHKNILEYFVSWKGYDAGHNSWEKAATMNADEAISRFEELKKNRRQGKKSTARRSNK